MQYATSQSVISETLLVQGKRCTCIVTPLLALRENVCNGGCIETYASLLFQELWKTVVQLCLKSNSWSVRKHKKSQNAEFHSRTGNYELVGKSL